MVLCLVGLISLDWRFVTIADDIYLKHSCGRFTRYDMNYVLICEICDKKVPSDIVTQIKLLNDIYSPAKILPEDSL